MAIPIVPHGMGYADWSRRVHRPTNLRWITLCETEYEDYMRSHSHLPGWIERRRVVRKMKIIHILKGLI